MYSHVLVSREVPHVLLGRVGVVVLQRDGAHGHVRHLRGRHRELHRGPARQLRRDLVVRRQSHAAHQVVRRVRAWKHREAKASEISDVN